MLSARSALGRRTLSTTLVRKCYDPRNKISGAYNPTIKREGPSAVKTGNPEFLTRATFEEQMKSQRTLCAGADFGVQPTKWQRRFLVITKMYETEGDIPLFVASGTMNRMHDRMRILSTFLGICGFFILFYYNHSANVGRVMRDLNCPLSDAKKTHRRLERTAGAGANREVLDASIQ
ncbi:hypothetical protein ANCCEY_11764 [Ancylostoma ceylanicum]|uniref:Uncharacterized protein n=1 Tax=Ancylostoma ceylanicum TaxID=53326 RepID=A0A0D6LD14_9BILA|nr:hypothetical protein ANCCEY_11764 [Ancylostoma ceylanicum]